MQSRQPSGPMTQPHARLATDEPCVHAMMSQAETSSVQCGKPGSSCLCTALTCNIWEEQWELPLEELVHMPRASLTLVPGTGASLPSEEQLPLLHVIRHGCRDPAHCHFRETACMWNMELRGLNLRPRPQASSFGSLSSGQSRARCRLASAAAWALP